MHAVFRLEEEEFQDHHLAFEAGKGSALARRGFGDAKLWRFAWYLGLRLCQCGGRGGCDDECQHHGGQRWPIHRIHSLALPRLIFALQNRIPRLRMIAYSNRPGSTHHFIIGSTYQRSAASLPRRTWRRPRRFARRLSLWLPFWAPAKW